MLEEKELMRRLAKQAANNMRRRQKRVERFFRYLRKNRLEIDRQRDLVLALEVASVERSIGGTSTFTQVKEPEPAPIVVVPEVIPVYTDAYVDEPDHADDRDMGRRLAHHDDDVDHEYLDYLDDHGQHPDDVSDLEDFIGCHTQPTHSGSIITRAEWLATLPVSETDLSH